MATRTAFSGALCGEAFGILGTFPEGGSKRGLGWCLKIFPFASLGSEAGVGWLRYAVRWNNGDPACWRPARGAGFDCAALFGCIARPYTRCAASLRMTRGGQGRGTIYVWCKI